MKKRKIFYTILLFLSSVIIALCLFAKNEFGNPQFEQIIFSLFLSEGSSVDVILSGVFYCLPIVIIGLLVFVPWLYLDFSKFKNNIPFYKGLYTSIIFIASLCYAGFSIGFFDYLIAQLHDTTLFEDYYVDPKDVEMIFPKQKKNLIYIMVESLESSYAQGYIDQKNVNLIPNLTSYAKDYINFSENENIGGATSIPLTTWTAAGTIAQISGLPIKNTLFKRSYGKDGKFLPGAIMLGDILEKEGYQSYYMSGSDAAFAAHDDLFTSHGNYEILDYKWAKKEGLIPEDYYEFWGYEDKKIYEFAQNKLLEISKKDEPFNFLLTTLDTHVVDGYLDKTCDNSYDYQYASVISCADQKLSNFLSWLFEQDFYDNTVIIISGDHITMQTDIATHLQKETKRSIYNVIINSNVKPIYEKNRNFTTLDMFPTTLASLGVTIKGDRLGLGTNLFSEEKTLLEKLGYENLSKEIVKYSKYYNEKFLFQ